jgi:hypothetical protein
VPKGLNLTLPDFSTAGGHDRLEMHLLAAELEQVRSGEQKLVFVKYASPKHFPK